MVELICITRMPDNGYSGCISVVDGDSMIQALIDRSTEERFAVLSTVFHF